MTYGYEHAKVVQDFLNSLPAEITLTSAKVSQEKVATTESKAAKTVASSNGIGKPIKEKKPVPFFLKEKTESTSKETMMAGR